MVLDYAKFFEFNSRIRSSLRHADKNDTNFAQLFSFAYVRLMLNPFFLCSESNPSNLEKGSSSFATKYAVFSLISISFRS